VGRIERVWGGLRECGEDYKTEQDFEKNSVSELEHKRTLMAIQMSRRGALLEYLKTQYRDNRNYNHHKNCDKDTTLPFP